MIQAFTVLKIVALLGCASSCAYYLFCLWSAASFMRTAAESRSHAVSGALPPVSILKPLKGTDPDIYESFRSHCLQDYPEYEIIFGVSDASDPAVAAVNRLQSEFPNRNIRLLVCGERLGANVKVSNLHQMLAEARHEYLVVNDSDIRVEPDYLQRVTPPLSDERTGMVTCLYRGVAAPTLGSRLEALGISTDFCAGVLAARQLERGIRFGLGSTLAFRRKDLQSSGGFDAIVDYLADDYELGRRIAGLGLAVVLSEVVVETHLPAYDLRGYLSHQLRWARGVRDSRAGGYFGLVVTFGLMWGLLLLVTAHGAPWSLLVFAIVALLRGVLAITIGKRVLHDAQVMRDWWLLPVRDAIGVCVWLASFAGHTVTWRGDRFELKNGKLIRID